MTTKAAQRFVSHKIERLRHEGVSERMAVAIAFSEARERGYSVPPAPHSPERRR